MFLSNYEQELQQPLLAECGHSQVLLEQYLDFLSNRSFRQTLLVHSERAGQVKYQIDQQRLSKLSVAVHLRCTQEQGDVDGEQRFETLQGRGLGIRSPVVKIAADSLAAAWPRTMSLEALLNTVKAALGELPSSAESHILELFQHLVIKGIGRYQLTPVTGTSDDNGNPQVSPQAIAYGKLEQTGRTASTYSPWHETVMLDAASAFLLPLLDGSHSRLQLIDAMRSEVKSERLRFFNAGELIIDEEMLHEAMVRHLDRILELMVA